jgi:hypothetical protein
VFECVFECFRSLCTKIGKSRDHKGVAIYGTNRRGRDKSSSRRFRGIEISCWLTEFPKDAIPQRLKKGRTTMDEIHGDTTA